MRDSPHVTVKLVYLARLRDAFGTAGESLALPGGTGLTVGALVAALRARGGPFAAELAPGKPVRVAVNHALADQTHPVCDGDEVALLPPVTGG